MAAETDASAFGDQQTDMGELFPSELLTREQALERFLTPLPVRAQNRSVPLVRQRIISLGQAGDTLVYRPSVPYMNHQIREAYDTDHVLRLGREIQQMGQLQDCGVAIFTGRSALEAYLSDSNDYYDTTVKASDIPEHKLGGRLVTIYGHNRQLGVAAVNLALHGHPDRGIGLRARLYTDPEFRDFLRMQAVENTGQAPPAWNRARSIARYMELSMRDGQPPSWSELAEYYGVTEDQIWRAFNYVQLPKSVQEMVETEKIPYSGAIELKRLQGIYAEQDIEALAKEFASQGISGAKIEQEVSKRVATASLPPEIQLLIENQDVSQQQAVVLREMHFSGASPDEMRQTISWILTSRPRIAELREHASSFKRNSRNGQLNIYDSGYSEEQQQAEQERVAQANLKLQIARAARDIVTDLNGFKGLVEKGLAGEMIAEKPIAQSLRNLNGFFEHTITGLEEMTAEDQEAVELLRQSLTRLNGSMPPQLRKSIRMIIKGYDELLEAEHNSSVEDQKAQLERIRQRVASAGAGQPVVESLF